jgi:hypothetical protein
LNDPAHSARLVEALAVLRGEVGSREETARRQDGKS